MSEGFKGFVNKEDDDEFNLNINVDEVGKIKHLLLTEAELDKCEDRAKKNREDLPSGFTAIYVQRNTFW